MSILSCQKGRKKHQQNSRLPNNKGSLASAVAHNSSRLCRRDQNWTGSMAALAFLVVLVVCLGGRTALCILSLNVPHETQGIRGESVVIPCTYTPSAHYKEHQVDWYAEDVKIFSRFESRSYILKADYSGRIQVADSRPGDVSLTIKVLKMIERGNYRCVVIWKSNDGLTVTKEGFSKLTVLRAAVYSPTKKPDVASVSTKGSTTVPIYSSTAKPDVAVIITKEHGTMPICSSTAKPDVAVIITKEHGTIPIYSSTAKPDVAVIITKGHGTSTLKNTEFTTNRKSATTKSRHTTKKTASIQQSKIPVLDSTKDAAENAKLDYIIKGSGVPLYIILLIALVCALSILTLIIVFVTRRKKNTNYIYDMPTMSQLAARLDGSAPLAYGGYSSCACQTPRTQNDYQPCKQGPETEYETMVAQASNEYEFLIPEREAPPSCSAFTEPNPAVPPSPRSTFLL
ncbi:V-set and immunoglobulin domain-containing protein 4 isoform X2 [Xenopus laevis]|uniref:V-set and immunoglobulin domain-containing protein 4 isoform X2 n=1 Tax=Xenopus laevis TaxID=8355 RepID=UPI001BB1ACDC|nr:V-set and immunoglobulin domain-containing protein 4 isoform X2 [Xenopus laevis]